MNPERVFDAPEGGSHVFLHESVSSDAERRARLILVCGLPGAGKTTLSRRIADRLGAFRMCPDETLAKRHIDLRDEVARSAVEERHWDVTQRLLKRGCQVIIESGFWARTERDQKREWAHSHGARVDLIYMTAPLTDLCARLSRRQAALGWAPISLAEMNSWAAVFEPPSAAEGRLFDSFMTIGA